MIESYSLSRLPDRYPIHGQWEITCRCNLKCVMCYTDCFNTPEKIRQELSTAEIKAIMDDIAAEGCVELCLTGGEPLARPDFREIYAYAKEKGFLITLFTNGTLIDNAMADFFASLQPRVIEISLHSLTPKTFETITAGKGSFDKCMEGIRRLMERRLPLVLKMVALTLNQDDVIAVKRFTDQFPSVRFKLGEDLRPTLDGNQTPGQYQLSEEALRRIKEQDRDIYLDSCQDESEKPFHACHEGKKSFHIDAYGSLQLCSGNRRQSYDLRKGSFREGFYEFLPHFPCPAKKILTGAESSYEGPC